MWNRLIALIIKELLAVLRDPKSRRAITIPPIVQLVIFAFAATLDVKNVPIGILNRDNGAQGFEFVQRFHGAPTFSHIIYLKAVDEIAPFMDNQKGVMVVHLDENFSKNLEANKPADVQLILDGRKSNTAQIVASYTNTIIDQFNQDFAAKVSLKQQNTQLFPYNWFNPNLLYYWYNVPSLLCILAMLTALIVTSTSVARERELGTFDQLLVSPLLPFEILIGKMIPGLIIGVGESIIILAVGTLVFQVPFYGSLLLLYFSLTIFICSIVGVGLFISSLCSTQQQAALGTFIFLVPAVILSGFATPIENMPDWLQPATCVFPLRYMLVISKGIFLKDMPSLDVFENIWPMVLISIFTMSCATWLFRRRLE